MTNTPDDNFPDFGEDRGYMTDEDAFLLDMGLTPDGDRVAHTYRRPDTGMDWDPRDADGAPPFGH
jgi:hypothetical protein